MTIDTNELRAMVKSQVGINGYVPTTPKRLIALADEIDRLCAIVDKLPLIWRLVDGKLVRDVPMTPGMTIYCLNGDHIIEMRDTFQACPVGEDGCCVFQLSTGLATYVSPKQLYATREAAEAARKEGKP